MTYLLMGLFIIVYALIAMMGVKYDPDKQNFFDLSDSTVLKGLFCIIVVLVHTPESWQNPIQDAMGSFAYIGVTFFFMTSAYGLKWGVLHKKNYLKRFWLKRLPALLIPAFLCNLVQMACFRMISKPYEICSLISINEFVKVLLAFNAVFWMIYYIPPKLGIGGELWQDIAICLIVAACSLMNRLTPIKPVLVWSTESLGFAYGILLADGFELFKNWSGSHWVKKSVFLFVLGCITGVAYLKLKPIDFWGDYCLKIFLGIVLLLLILQLTRKFRIGNRIIKFLGNVSYEVYLLHGTMFYVVMSIEAVSDSGVFIWLAISLIILSASIVSWLSDKLFHLIYYDL